MTGITDKFQSFVIDRLMGALAHSTKRPPSPTIYPPTPIPERSRLSASGNAR